MSDCVFICLVCVFFTSRSFSFADGKSESTSLNEDDTDDSERDDDNLSLKIQANANGLHLRSTEYLETDNSTCSRNESFGDYSNLLEQRNAHWITSP